MLRYAPLLLVIVIFSACLQHEEVVLSNVPYGHTAGVIVTFDTEVVKSGELESIARVLRNAGANATFFVVAGYFENSPDVLEPIRDFEVANMGWNQGRWKSYFTPEEHSEQILRADKWLRAQGFNVKGFRAPYLLYSDFAIRTIKGLNYSYDSSLYYDFLPYSLYGLVEVPVTLNFDSYWDETKMEFTLIPTYLALQKAIDDNGFFTLITHVDTVSKNLGNFTQFLDYAKKREIWFASAYEAAEWWKKREKLELEVEGERIIVRNRGSERVEGATVIIKNYRGRVEGGVVQYRNGDARYVVLPAIEPEGKAEVILRGR